jgi:hypothetical protein
MIHNGNAKEKSKKKEEAKEEELEELEKKAEKDKHVKIKINKHFECYNCDGLNNETYDCINY